MTTVLIPDTEMLRSPSIFERWVRDLRQQNCSYEQMAAPLSREPSDIAQLRAARLLANVAQDQRRLLHSCLTTCLLSDDLAICMYAKALVVESDLWDEHGNDAFAGPSLVDALRQLNQLAQRDAFTLEATCQVLNVLSLLSLETRAYQDGQAFASEGLVLAVPLEVHTLSINLRLNHGLACLRLGQFDQAQADYRAVLSDPHAGPTARIFAMLNSSALHAMHGEIKVALTQFAKVEDHRPGHAVAQVGTQYILALRGELSSDEEIIPCPDHNYDRITLALSLLQSAERMGRRTLIVDALDVLKAWRPRAESLVPVVTWVQTVALLRQGKPFLAAQRIASARPVQPLFQVLVQAAKLDIALHFDGVDLEAPEFLSQELSEQLSRLATRDAREGVAELLMLWHPLASAFLAVSPYSTPEIMDAALPAIFVDGRPIQIYGRAVPSRLPFVQVTLHAFGLPSEIGRDQSAELTRLDAVTVISWGRLTRRLPILPPALLIYHLMRTGENAGSFWTAAARELARTNGTIPTTLGSHLRSQRSKLHKLLDQLLQGELSAKQFKRHLATI